MALEREKEARSLFERLLERANDLRLYAEEIEPDTGAFLGNFPQAFTHLGLIGSAINLSLYEKHGGDAVRRCYAARAQRAVKAASGWRAVLAAFVGAGRWPRLRSSRRSKLVG